MDKIFNLYSIKKTHERICILEVLLETDYVFTISDICIELDNVSEKTIYNVVKRFCDAGIAERVASLDNKMKFKLTEPFKKDIETLAICENVIV